MNDPNLLALAVCAGLSLVGIVITAVIWKMAPVRTVVWWLGAALLPMAVYLLGLVPLAVDGYETLRRWYGTLAVTPLVWTGAVLGGLGLLLMLVSRVLPARPRQPKPAPPAGDRRAVPATPARPAPQVTPGQGTSRGPAGPATPSDSELDEVTEILRRRGIE